MIIDYKGLPKATTSAETRMQECYKRGVYLGFHAGADGVFHNLEKGLFQF